MNSQEEFEIMLEDLINDFPQFSYRQIAESLEYYAAKCYNKLL